MTRERPMWKYWFVPVLIGLSVAAWVSSASAVSSPQTFSLLEVEIPKNARPLGNFKPDRPPVAGDQFTVTNALYKWAGSKRGARAGRVQVLHTFITGFGSDFGHKATLLFEAQVYLLGGSMFVEGYGQVSPNGPSKIMFPIVGGTGTYANARGYLNLRTVADGKRHLTFHLLP